MLRDALCEQGAGMQPTWAARNPLTCGVIQESDHRCDYIFYRPMAGQHEMVNSSCRIVLDQPPFLSDHFGVLLEAWLRPVAKQAPASDRLRAPTE
jgi:endonuclease/exonuclease/phosphatase family metal-dependent hydrolase